MAIDDFRQHGFLIDMDGVIHRGDRLIPGADAFIARLIELQAPFLFLTNNSRRTRLDVATKLRRFGMPVHEKHVFTCAIATARFIREQKPDATAYVIGEGGLLSALDQAGVAIVDHDPDYVVVGEGRALNFEQIEHAVSMVLKGAKLIATNLDPTCPTVDGTRPGCGAIVAMLETATGRKAFSVGKPSPVMMRMARKELGLRTGDMVMIGDTMETDILGGAQMGYRTVLVLSGGTKAADVANYVYQPDLIVPSIADLIEWVGTLSGSGAEPAHAA